MVKLTTTQKWLRTIAWLRRNFPAQKPVLVRSVILKRDNGDTDYIKRKFVIRIHPKQSINLRLDSLLHEWAHCLTWFGAETDEDHSSEWGITYAKILRTWLEWNYGREEKEEDA